MAETSTIEWTDATWNVITGCTLVSEGCRRCYAATLAATRLKNLPSRQGLARINAAGEAKFTGEVRFNAEWLHQPLRWQRPRRVFVCAHGDLFHPSVPDAWIDQVFAVMALAPRHTFQVLTKRPERMREYLLSSAWYARAAYAIGAIASAEVTAMPRSALVRRSDRLAEGANRAALLTRLSANGTGLTNVWLGVSAEDQAAADARIPLLLETPATIRFVSLEPLLGPIDLRRIKTHGGWYDALEGWRDVRRSPPPEAVADWVIVGGESGAGARPMHPDWARWLRDQCQAADTTFFFKQWGAWTSQVSAYHPGDPDLYLAADGTRANEAEALKGGAWVGMYRLGKSKAGRRLDGIIHDAMPVQPSVPAATRGGAGSTPTVPPQRRPRRKAVA